VYRLGVVPCADWRKLFACARQLPAQRLGANTPEELAPKLLLVRSI
jgi:hypothetical protein